jgi:hypothetical protein
MDAIREHLARREVGPHVTRMGSTTSGQLRDSTGNRIIARIGADLDGRHPTFCTAGSPSIKGPAARSARETDRGDEGVRSGAQRAQGNRRVGRECALI